MTATRPLRTRPRSTGATTPRAFRPEGEPADAHATAIRLLARRELSEAQVRDRLTESFDAGKVEAAIARLKRDGVIDDRRVAAAYARTALIVKRRGRLRVERELDAMGIDRGLARVAVDAALQDVDEKAVLVREVERRLKGRSLDQRGRMRLYAQLLRRGFPVQLVMAVLGRHGPFVDEG